MSEMSQDDIDALLSGATGESSADPEGGGEIDQSSIDALFDGAGGAGGEVDQSSIDALFDSAGPTEETAPGGEVDQSSIDALFDGAGGAGGEVDQSSIGALFDSAGGASGEIDQSSIDALFDGAGGAGGGDDSAGDMESLLAEIQNDPSLSQSNEDVNINDLLTEIQTESPLTADVAGQEDIDVLMSSVGTADAGVDAMPLEVEEEGVNVDFLLDMKLTLTFEVGRAKMLIGDLLSLGQGSVIELHRLVGEDLDMFVSGRLIARGEVVVVNEKFGVRILDIVSPEDRIKQMAGFDRI